MCHSYFYTKFNFKTFRITIKNRKQSYWTHLILCPPTQSKIIIFSMSFFIRFLYKWYDMVGIHVFYFIILLTYPLFISFQKIASTSFYKYFHFLSRPPSFCSLHDNLFLSLSSRKQTWYFNAKNTKKYIFIERLKIF